MRNKDAGFSLIEFAIASLAALTMLAAAFTLMNTMFTANGDMGEVMATQQNVRVAMNTIARDITTAGTGLPTSAVAVPNGTNAVPIIRPGMAAFADPDRNIEAPNNAIPILSPGNSDGPMVSGVDTDALTIFSVDQTSPTWNIASIAVFSDRYEVTFTTDVSGGAMQLFAGDVLLFTNFNGSVLGCVTDVSTVTNTLAFFRETDLMGLNQPLAQFGNIDSLKNPGTNPAVFPPTTATRVNIVNYFISVDNAEHPRLIRAVNAQAPQIIAEDIENLQFSFDLFDFDTNAATSNQATTSLPNQIRAVRVSINGRSPERMKNGRYYHFPLASKINVRNSTFRNRYTGS